MAIKLSVLFETFASRTGDESASSFGGKFTVTLTFPRDLSNNTTYSIQGREIKFSVAEFAGDFFVYISQ